MAPGRQRKFHAPLPPLAAHELLYMPTPLRQGPVLNPLSGTYKCTVTGKVLNTVVPLKRSIALMCIKSTKSLIKGLWHPFHS